jgi:CBS domain-containing protein
MKRREKQIGSNAEGGATVEQVLSDTGPRELPVIEPDATVEEAISAMVGFPHSRILYVVDEGQHLLGTISLGSLVRHVFSSSHEPKVHARHLIGMITTEFAEELMHRHPVYATAGEEVEVVLKRMVGNNVKEIGVVDEEMRLVADLTMIDLLAFLDR